WRGVCGGGGACLCASKTMLKVKTIRIGGSVLATLFMTDRLGQLGYSLWPGVAKSSGTVKITIDQCRLKSSASPYHESHFGAGLLSTPFCSSTWRHITPN